MNTSFLPNEPIFGTRFLAARKPIHPDCICPRCAPSTSSESGMQSADWVKVEEAGEMKAAFLPNEPILSQLLPPQSPGNWCRGAPAVSLSNLPAPRGYRNARAEAPPLRPILHWSADLSADRSAILSAVASWRRRKPWSADFRSGV